MSFEENKTLDQAMDVAVERVDTSRRERRAVMWTLWWPRHRREFEQRLTAAAMAAGAIPPAAMVKDGVFCGNWLTDLLDWIVNNWETILEIISTILLFF